MKVLLTIGHTHVLLPDDTGLSTIMKQLSKGMIVYDHRYRSPARLELRGGTELKTEYVSKDVELFDPDKKADQPASRKRTIALAPVEPVLRLTAGG